MNVHAVDGAEKWPESNLAVLAQLVQQGIVSLTSAPRPPSIQDQVTIRPIANA